MKRLPQKYILYVLNSFDEWNVNGNLTGYDSVEELKNDNEYMINFEGRTTKAWKICEFREIEEKERQTK